MATANTNILDIFEDLIDDDPFIRSYPSFDAYIREWDDEGGDEVSAVPERVIFEFYAEKVPVGEALHLWLTYSPVEQIEKCK